jgi:hypothetical protein
MQEYGESNDSKDSKDNCGGDSKQPYSCPATKSLFRSLGWGGGGLWRVISVLPDTPKLSNIRFTVTLSPPLGYPLF